MAEPNQTISLHALRQLCNLETRRVQQLTKEGVMFKQGRDEYLLVQSVQGYIKYLQDRSSSTVANHDLNVERARLTFHQANKTEVEEQLLKGEVVMKTDVDSDVMFMLSQFRSRMTGLPMRIAQVALEATSLHEIEKECREEIYTALNELVGGLGRYENQQGGAKMGASPEATAPA